MTPQVRIGGPGGTWLSTIAPVGGIELDVRWPLGGYQLDFNVLLNNRSRPRALVDGAGYKRTIDRTIERTTEATITENLERGTAGASVGTGNSIFSSSPALFVTGGRSGLAAGGNGSNATGRLELPSAIFVEADTMILEAGWTARTYFDAVYSGISWEDFEAYTASYGGPEAYIELSLGGTPAIGVAGVKRSSISVPMIVDAASWWLKGSASSGGFNSQVAWANADSSASAQLNFQMVGTAGTLGGYPLTPGIWVWNTAPGAGTSSPPQRAGDLDAWLQFTYLGGGAWTCGAASGSDLVDTSSFAIPTLGLPGDAVSLIVDDITIHRRGTYDNPIIVPGVGADDSRAICDLMIGGSVLFTGSISDGDLSDEGSVTAIGLCRDAETIPALASSLTDTTSVPDTAVDTARTLGWRVTRPASLSTAAVSSDDSMTSTASLLETWSGDNGKRWYVDPDGAVRAATDPVTPELYVVPGVGELPWTTERQATKLVGSWINSSGATKVTVVGTGAQVRQVDLSNRGILTSTQATSILNQILARSSSSGWTGGITLTAEQIITPGGNHPSLAHVARMVGRGVMVRLLGHRDPRPDRFSLATDVVIGQAIWNVDDGTIALTPVGAVARDFTSVVEELGGTVAA